MVADFKAFETYLAQWDKNTSFLRVESATASSIPKSFLMVEFARASENPAMRHVTAHAIERQMQGVDNNIAAAMSLIGLPGKRQAYIENFLAHVQKTPIMESMGGGSALLAFNTFYMDERTVTKLGNQLFPHASPTDISRFRTMVRHHEAAHLMLGLKEPGADFVSAALTLREDPGAHKILRQFADIRMLHGMSSGGGNAAAYGVECHDAIERVLSIPPEKLKSMSLQQLYEAGKKFDSSNDLHASKGLHSPENNVRTAIGGIDLERGLKYIWYKATNLEVPKLENIAQSFVPQMVSVQQMRDGLSQAEFPKGSEEARIAKDLGESLTRTPHWTPPRL